MGDRCYLELKFRKNDEKKLKKILGLSEVEHFWYELIDETPVTIKVGIPEANYGWEKELRSASENGLTFTGYSGPGGNYSSSLFASHGGAFASCMEIERCPAARIWNDGFPIPKDIGEVQEYRRLKRLADQYLEMEDCDQNNGSQHP